MMNLRRAWTTAAALAILALGSASISACGGSETASQPAPATFAVATVNAALAESIAESWPPGWSATVKTDLEKVAEDLYAADPDAMATGGDASALADDGTKLAADAAAAKQSQPASGKVMSHLITAGRQLASGNGTAEAAMYPLRDAWGDVLAAALVP